MRHHRILFWGASWGANEGELGTAPGLEYDVITILLPARPSRVPVMSMPTASRRNISQANRMRIRSVMQMIARSRRSTRLSRRGLYA